MRSQIQLFIIIILSTSSSCNIEKQQIIPWQFEKYVNTFFEEANLRGLNIHIEDFDLEFEMTDIENPITMGDCDMNKHKIRIDEEKWERLNEIDKEYLIFHELGHCVLGRFHKNERTGNEECLSYMKGDEDNFKCSMNKYSEIWRNFYLDELFNQEQKLPNWYTEDKVYNNVFQNFSNDYNIVDTITNELSINDFQLNGNDDYAIEIEYDDWKNVEHSVYLLIGNIAFGYCTCTVGKISINIGSNRAYSADNISFAEEKTILTIHKKGDLMNFYVNGRFIHTFETISQSTFNIKTKYHDNPMRISLKIQRQ
jgi:hypothetical protein